MGDPSMTAELRGLLEAESQAKEVRRAMYDSTGKLDIDHITFGCELEFSLAHHREPGTTIDWEHGKEKVREALSQPLSVQCTTPKCNRRHTFRLPMSNHEESDTNSWQVTRDGTIRDPLREPEQLGLASFTFYPIEVRSRVLHLHETLPTLEDGHKVSVQQEITAILNTLNHKFGILDDGATKPAYYPIITPKCGFHVHVGAGVYGAVPFLTVRRVFSTFIACERQIDGLHAQNRITGTELSTIPLGLTEAFIYQGEHHLLSYSFNRPLSVFFIVGACIRRQQLHQREIIVKHQQKKLQKGQKDPSSASPSDSTSSTSSDEVAVSKWYPDNMEGEKDVWNHLEPNLLGCDVRSWLNLVHHAEDARELRELTRMADKNCTLNFQNLPSSGTPTSQLPGKKRTIEFRQHIGTLEPTTALSFIDVVVTLVLYCQGITEERFEALYEAEFSNPEFSTLKFCKLIGCKKATVEHYRRMSRSEDNAFTTYLGTLEEQAVEAKKRDIPLSFFALEQVKWLREETKPDSVKQQINDKLLAGGYGHFDPEYLSKVLPKHTDPEVSARLCKGSKSTFIQEETLGLGKKPEDPHIRTHNKLLTEFANAPIGRSPSSTPEPMQAGGLRHKSHESSRERPSTSKEGRSGSRKPPSRTQTSGSSMSTDSNDSEKRPKKSQRTGKP